MNTVTVAGATSLTANISVAADATAGSRTVSVTTGGEVVTFVNGFTVGAGAPRITLVNPNTGQVGQTLILAITGQFTSFVQGTTAVSLGAGITVNSVTVTSLTSLTAGVSIASNAAAGARTVTVTTGAEVVSLANGFNVATASGPQISDFNPKTGPVGTLIAITGANLQPASGSPQVTLAAQVWRKHGSAGFELHRHQHSICHSHRRSHRPHHGQVGTQSVSSSSPLTVVASSSFTLTALPGAVSVLPGQSSAVAVSLSSNTGFSQLAGLSVSGLPSGITGTVKPQQITAGQTSVLTLEAPARQPLGSPR